MDSDRADEIRKRMTEQRGALRDDLDFLVAQARLKTDWRHYIRRYPWVFMGAGAVLGYLLVPSARRGILGPTALERGGRAGSPGVLSPSGSISNLLTGTVLPLVVRMATTKLLAKFLTTESSDRAGAPATSFTERPRQPR